MEKIVHEHPEACPLCQEIQNATGFYPRYCGEEDTALL